MQTVALISVICIIKAKNNSSEFISSMLGITQLLVNNFYSTFANNWENSLQQIIAKDFLLYRHLSRPVYAF